MPDPAVIARKPLLVLSNPGDAQSVGDIRPEYEFLFDEARERYMPASAKMAIRRDSPFIKPEQAKIAIEIHCLKGLDPYDPICGKVMGKFLWLHSRAWHPENLALAYVVKRMAEDSSVSPETAVRWAKRLYSKKEMKALPPLLKKNYGIKLKKV